MKVNHFHNYFFYGWLTSEIELDDLDIGDPDWRFRDSLLVIVVPFAAQPLSLVPDLDEILIVLNDDVVLVELAVEVGPRAAPVVHDLELVLVKAGLRLHVNTLVLIHSSLGKKTLKM